MTSQRQRKSALAGKVIPLIFVERLIAKLRIGGRGDARDEDHKA
jgi:hypothetical protein